MTEASAPFELAEEYDPVRDREGVDLEFKKAQGRDGKGAVPEDMWETYSAMANTDGGSIVLGVEWDKKHDKYNVLGITNPERLVKTLWDNLHNPQIVSTCHLSSRNILEIPFRGKRAVLIDVPRADRAQRPVYVGQNPLSGTFRRCGEGDYKCNADTVKRMLADAVSDSLDSVIFTNFNLDDVDLPSLASWRNELYGTNPNHPFLARGDLDLLKALGGWQTDRQTKDSGLTLAGLLMFGKLTSIREACPMYMLDYQEVKDSAGGWVDRITTDHTWVGNLYSFFHRVYPKLIADLKVPFQFAPEDAAQRVDVTEVHTALREALVNALVHADYGGRISILIHKRPNLFGFRNPGGLRLALDVIYAGGASDCRNRNLQQMFFLIGKAERSGLGVGRILKGWKSYHKAVPLLREGRESEPDQTVLVLPLASLLPPEAVEGLQRMFGKRMAGLSPIERIAMVTAYNEGLVTNVRMRSCTSEQSHKLTPILRGLVEKGLLDQEGFGTGTWYHIPGMLPNRAAGSLFDTTGTVEAIDKTLSNNGSSESNDGSLNPNDASLETNLHHLVELARPVKESGRVAVSTVDTCIVRMCQVRALSTQELSALLGRSSNTLTLHYLSRLVKQGRLRYRYGKSPKHPRQAYVATFTET